MTDVPEDVLRQLGALDYELHRRREEIQRRNNYYDGRQPLQFASAQYREWFGNQYQGFADNWCAPVVDAMAERLRVAGVRPRGEQKVDKELRRAWEESGAASESPLAFTASAVTGRSFGLVWGTEDDEAEVTFEDASQAVVAYEPGSRRRRKCALKMWTDPWTGKDHATLYTPEALWKFERGSARRADELTGLADRALIVPATALLRGGWSPRESADEPWPLPNPLGVVPLVEIANRPKLLGEPLSEIDGVIAMQDAINAMWAYLFTAADFAALPQRVILGAELPKMPILDEAGRVIGHKPLDLPEVNVKRILNFEGPNAKIGQWDAADLDAFLKVVERAANHIGNQTRTPLYYFASSIQNISGDTLKALETGLVSKVGDRQEVHEDPIRELHRMVALVQGDEEKAKAVAGGTVIWQDHESRSEAQKVDALSKLKDIGFPVRYLVEQYTGGDADEVERIMNMRQDEFENDPIALLARQAQNEPGYRPGDDRGPAPRQPAAGAQPSR